MAKDYPNPPPAGSETLLPFHSAALDRNLSILRTRLNVAKAVEKRVANYLRIAEENDEETDVVRYLERKLAEQKLKVSRSETRLEREKVAGLAREVAFLRSRIVQWPAQKACEVMSEE